MQSDELSETEVAEVAQLAKRAGGVDRRKFLVTSGRVLAFAIPALMTFSVPRSALGQTGSGGSGSGSGSGSGKRGDG